MDRRLPALGHLTILEPPVPAAWAPFLRLDAGLLTIAAQASPPLAETKDDPRKLARWIRNLPAGDKERLLQRVAQGHSAQVQMELRPRFHGEPCTTSDSRSRRAVAELLDAATEARQKR